MDPVSARELEDELRAEIKYLKESNKFPFNQTRDQWWQVLAALAMAGLAASEVDFPTVEKMAEVSQNWADAMINQSEKGE